MAHSSTTRIIITGAPGTGKSSIISRLEEMGHPCYSEIARTVIEDQLKIGSDYLPWLNVDRFSELVIERTLVNLKSSNDQGLCFFDRGLPDTLAYLRLEDNFADFGIPEIIQEFPYHPTVYYTPFWEDIYITDTERRETPDHALRIEASLKSVYKELGYNLREIPKAGLDERCKFVLNDINETAAISL